MNKEKIKQEIFKDLDLEYSKPEIIHFNYEDVRTWSDVCQILRTGKYGEFNSLPYVVAKTKLEKTTNAFVKINYISKVLNNGWVPDFTNENEKKYYLWFKREHGLAGSGGVWSVGVGDYASDITNLGFGCHFKSREIALHAGKYFLDVYNDYLPE